VVPRASLPVFMLSIPGHVFGGTEGVGFLFHVLRSRTHFQRYRGRRVPFSRFALSDSFSAVLGVLGPVFLFCAPRLIFGCFEGAGPVFMFWLARLIFGGTECVRSRFQVLRSRTLIRRYRGRRVLFSCFARPESFSAASWALGPVFKLCALRFIFGGTEGVGSCFHVLRSQTRFRRYRGVGSRFLILRARTHFR
jgi:hypothetical protein